MISACADLAIRIVRGSNLQGGINGSHEKPVVDQNSLIDWVAQKDKGKAKENARDERVLVVIG